MNTPGPVLGQLPPAGSGLAGSHDVLFSFLFWVNVFFFVLVIGGMIYFLIRYRAAKNPKATQIEGSNLLEVIWTAIPTVLLLVIFGWGYYVYSKMVRAPADAYEVRVIGKQWLWQFQYDHGVTTIGELYVPLNKPVKLVMTATDVLHSFFIPNFRVKQDVVPGMYTSVWFEATMPGRHQVYCTEYCGAAHSNMMAQVIVLDDEQWNGWLRGKKIEIDKLPGLAFSALPVSAHADSGGNAAEGAPKLTSLAERGKQLSQTKGCVACHSIDGKPGVGPSYKGRFGKEIELADGSKVLVDDNYVRESIENPNAKVVKGFSPVMPTFKGLITDEEMNALIAFIKSVK